VAEVTLSAEGLPWDAYEVRADLRDSAGTSMLSSRATAVVLPDGEYRVRMLNNLACELMNASERGLIGNESIPFMNPRDGWVFFSVSGDGCATLDEGDRLEDGESMRRLPAGRHILRIEGALDRITVHSVPEIVYCEYPSGPGYPGYDISIFGDLQGPSRSGPRARAWGQWTGAFCTATCSGTAT